ncbi:hypothetical protein GCM10011584_10390 [Nocardioides phosphati]|uniref:LppX_LprAFG lipoprotein n=1 Tax=Nocardioides phosphati TaxID=1867775 RepID=A0ABQ2N713_9ACTN|nr:hypothetical protein [Nocardioides phosphati]GGO86951.1 hypothetical protein GCM10011584_10390 [Nocardioides phosphati]
MPRLRTPIGTALIGAALLASLTACGTDSTKDDHVAYTPLTKATFGKEVAAATADEETVHVGGDLGGQKLDMWMEIGKDAASTSMKGGMGTSEVLLVDGTFYTRQKGDAKWSELPPEFSKTMTGTLEDMSPEKMASDYAKSLETLSYKGDKKVGGESLHSYDLTLDQDYALAKMRKQAQALGMDPSTLKAKDLPEMSYSVLLDDDNLMRRLEIEVGGQNTVMTMDHWGDDVDIKAPAADEVTQVS